MRLPIRTSILAAVISVWCIGADAAHKPTTLIFTPIGTKVDWDDSENAWNGKAYLDVSVYTNSEVKARGEGEGWGVATNGVIEVPAPGKQGFFYLMSKPGVPTDRGRAIVTGPTCTPGK